MSATVNADDRVFPPLIIYAGENLQSTWQGHKYLPATMYRVSNSGWMTSEVFFPGLSNFVMLLKKDPFC